MTHSSTIVHVDAPQLTPQSGVRPTPYGYVGTKFPRIDTFQNTISKWCAWLSGVAILALVLVTAVEIFSRLLFHHPLGWNIGVTEKYFLPIAGFFGVITAYRAGAHIAVTTAFSHFPPPLQKVVLCFCHVVVLATLAFLLLGGWQEFLVAWELNHRTLPGMAELPLPDWTYRIIVPAACVTGIPVVAADLFKELATPWSAPATLYEAAEADNVVEGDTDA